MMSDRGRGASATSSRGAIGVYIVTAILVLVLAWKIFVGGLAGSVTTPSPLLVTMSGGGDSDVLSHAADKALLEVDPTAAESLARQAVMINPLDSKAVLVLALVNGGHGQVANTDTLMAVVDRLSRRQRLAESWLFDLTMTKGDYTAAFRHADALVRHREAAEASVFPALIATSDFAPALPALARQLATMPPWRQSFFDAVGAAKGKANLPALLNALVAVRAPATAPELAPLIAREIRLGDTDGARQLVRAATGREPQSLNDGSFETTDANASLGWNLLKASSGFAEIAAREDGKGRALRLQLSGRGRAGPLVQQMLILGAGRYRLSGTARGDAGANGMTIRLTCSEGSTLLARAPGISGQWQPFAIAFMVPAQRCRSQRIELVTTASSAERDVELWFDDLKIDRVPA